MLNKKDLHLIDEPLLRTLILHDQLYVWSKSQYDKRQ